MLFEIFHGLYEVLHSFTYLVPTYQIQLIDNKYDNIFISFNNLFLF